MIHKAWCGIEEVPYWFLGHPLNFKVAISSLSKITRPVAAITSLRFALLNKRWPTELHRLEQAWNLNQDTPACIACNKFSLICRLSGGHFVAALMCYYLNVTQWIMHCTMHWWPNFWNVCDSPWPALYLWPCFSFSAMRGICEHGISKLEQRHIIH